MKSNYILGSGLVALICRKILGPDWKIIPFGPSRSYGKGIPALGDDFVHYDNSVLDIISNWGLNTSPLFYKRPLSISGSLLYNKSFINEYLAKAKLPQNRLYEDYFKSDFTVFGFSCLQMHRMLLRELLEDIRSFSSSHKNYKKVKSIKNHTIILDSGEVLEYDNVISTVPYYALCEMINIENTGAFLDLYYYFIQDDNVDLESANQALVCDQEVFFNKCTKISKNKYLFEVIGEYYDDIQREFSQIIGSDFEILSGAMIQNGYPLHSIINNQELECNNITCIGSHAQCDPLMDISSVIKRVSNLLNKNKIQN